MRKENLIYVSLIILGILFEYIVFTQEVNNPPVIWGILGVFSIIFGLYGLIWNLVFPILEKREKTLGQFKKKTINSRKLPRNKTSISKKSEKYSNGTASCKKVHKFIASIQKRNKAYLHVCLVYWNGKSYLTFRDSSNY